MCADPKCMFCEKCLNCGHQSDEHIAGDGHCFICNCGAFEPQPDFTPDKNDSLDNVLESFGLTREDLDKI